MQMLCHFFPAPQQALNIALCFLTPSLDTAAMPKPICCHIFCSVIDNFGDMGVSWRLARHLAAFAEVRVVLFVDDLTSFQHLAPALLPERQQQMLGDVLVHAWQTTCTLPEPADIVIEAFACTLPTHYLAAMAQRETAPIWLNLEYLSAENWIESCHGLTSVEPTSGLIKTFWFPGFTAATGGLLLANEEHAHILQPSCRQNSRRQITLFAYENAGISCLLDALAADTTPSLLLVFAGKGVAAIAHWMGSMLTIGAEATFGSLTIRLINFLPHHEYDQLLAQSDLNLVRGEDSFVRAQWAGAPLLWHIYPQAEDAHLIKLAAWQCRVTELAARANAPMPESWSARLLHWNIPDATCTMADWQQFLADLPTIRTAMLAWRQHLLAQPDLATQLMRFYADRVESTPK